MSPCPLYFKCRNKPEIIQRVFLPPALNAAIYSISTESVSQMIGVL